MHAQDILLVFPDILKTLSEHETKEERNSIKNFTTRVRC